jgi:hypothetical protein
MDKKSIKSNDFFEFLTLDEAARFIRRPVQYLRAEVANKRIPYIPPAEDPRFYLPHLREAVLKKEVLSGDSTRSTPPEDNKLAELIRLIMEQSSLLAEYLGPYVNLRLRKGGRVLAQLHTDSDSHGLFLAIPEAEGDQTLTEVKNLERLPHIDELAQGKGPAGSWLRGDGKRFTHRPAVAFHISGDMADDPEHPAWSDIRELLEYAKKRSR